MPPKKQEKKAEESTEMVVQSSEPLFSDEDDRNFEAMKKVQGTMAASNTTTTTQSSSDDNTPDLSQKPKTRKKNMVSTIQKKIVFTEDQEADLGMWYKVHPILYDKSLREYKDVDRKMALYDEKGKSMDPPVGGECTLC